MLPLGTDFDIEMSSTKAKQFFRDLNVDRAKSGTKLTAKCDRQSRRVCRIAKCGLRVVPIARNSCTTANFRTFLLTVFLVRRKIRPVVLGKIMHGRKIRCMIEYESLKRLCFFANSASITIVFTAFFTHDTFSSAPRSSCERSG